MDLGSRVQGLGFRAQAQNSRNRCWNPYGFPQGPCAQIAQTFAPK